MGIIQFDEPPLDIKLIHSSLVWHLYLAFHQKTSDLPSCWGRALGSSFPYMFAAVELILHFCEHFVPPGVVKGTYFWESVSRDKGVVRVYGNSIVVCVLLVPATGCW